MFTLVEKSTRRTVSAMAAVAIVSLSGLVMDQAHVAAAPRGIVEVGELQLISAGDVAIAMLPEVIVLARRESGSDASFAVTAVLPEIVVVAKRVATLVAQAETAERANAGQKGSIEGALLK